MTHRITLHAQMIESVIGVRVLDAIGAEATWMTPRMLAWWQKSIQLLSTTPRFQTPELNADMLADGHTAPDAVFQIIFCGRQAFDLISQTSNQGLGCFVLRNTQFDIFDDESDFSKGYRILVVSEREEFLDYIREICADDANPENYLHEYVDSYLRTTFHEIAHALLFAQNAALLSADDIDRLSSQSIINNDPFDTCTGYGIRPLHIDGKDIWSETVQDAAVHVEEYVESEARTYMNDTFRAEHTMLSYLDAAEVAKDVHDILMQHQTA